MNADETVRALRIQVKACGGMCDSCPADKYREVEGADGACDDGVMLAAADLIERLQGNLNDMSEQCEKQDVEIKSLRAQLEGAEMVIGTLRKELTASQARERAAVEDFKSAAHNGNILCEFCGADCIDAGNDTGGDTDQCGCFVYRGPQEAGEVKQDG